MNLNKMIIKFRSLNDWFNSPLGKIVAQSFAAELSNFSDGMRGETLLQLASCGENLWLPELRFSAPWIVQPAIGVKQSSLVASLDALPLDRNSIDCVLAPLTMEAVSERSGALIDEIDRVLKPMGLVVFFGINPWSFWGAALKLKILPCFGRETVKLTSAFSLKRILSARNYAQCLHTTFYHIPPVSQLKVIRKLEFLNEVGKMIYLFPPGFYCLVMQKYQNCPPPLMADTLGKKFMVKSDKDALLPVGQWSHKSKQVENLNDCTE